MQRPSRARASTTASTVAVAAVHAQIAVWVPRLVQHHLHPTGQVEHRDDAVALVLGLVPHLDALAAQLGDGGGDVIAHERQLVADAARVGRSFGRMHAQLRRRQGEDEPAVAGIDVLPAEDVPQRRSQRLGLRRVQQGVDSRDGHARHSATDGAAPARLAPPSAGRRGWKARARETTSPTNAAVHATRAMASASLGTSVEVAEAGDGDHPVGRDAVHADGEDEGPVGRVVAQRHPLDEVAPDADGDHDGEPEGGGGPGEDHDAFDERSEPVEARGGRPGRRAGWSRRGR